MNLDEQQKRYRWMIVGGSFVIMFFSSGTWTSFGLFLKPLQADFQWTRSTISVAVSINMLVYGFCVPLVGKIADRIGPRRVILFGLSTMVLSTLLLSRMTSVWHLYLVFGVGVGIGASSSSFVTHFTLLGRWFADRRGLALSLTSSGSSLGTFLWFPVLNLGIISLGWSYTYVVQGLVLAGVAIPLALFVLADFPSQRRSDSSTPSNHESVERVDAVLESGAIAIPVMTTAAIATPSDGPRDGPSDDLLPDDHTVASAARTSTFWLLASSQLACGFTWMFIIVHLPSFVTDLGYSSNIGARALAVLGAANIVGNISLGAISDRVGRRRPLVLSYLVRGLALLFLVYSQSLLSIFVFAITAGFGLLATVPLTTSIAQRSFGMRNSGAILGSITFIHQIGAALGSLFGGLIFDHFGQYDVAFLVTGFVAVSAAAISLSVRDESTVPALAPAPS